MSAQIRDDKAMADNVRRLRVAAGLSQDKLAAAMVKAGRTHWRQNTVSRIERAEQRLTAGESKALEAILGGSVTAGTSFSWSGAAAIHVCDATCLCGGRCSETQALRDLTARSSLGNPEAAALRESIPPELAERALRRAAEMERDAAIAERDALRDRILDSLVWKGDEVLALLDDGKEESL